MTDRGTEMDARQRKAVCGASTDIISNIPQTIIERILEKMPLRDAVRTCTLSSKWMYAWTSLPILTLGTRFSNSVGPDRYVSIVNKILLLHNGPIIKVCLTIPNSNMFPDVGAWIVFLSRKGIQRLTLENPNIMPYKVPLRIFSSVQLTYLKLLGCIFTPLSSLKGFGNLTSLHLYNSTLSDNFLSFISACPLLKRLLLYKCVGIDHLNLCAPNLTYLDVCGDLNTISLVHATNLTDVSINLPNMMTRVEYTRISVMDNVLTCLTKLVNLSLGEHVFKLLTAGRVPLRLPLELVKLKHLHLYNLDFNQLDDACCTLCLIRSAPNLSRLEIWAPEMPEMVTETDHVFWQKVKEVDPQFWEESTLRELLAIEIISIRGVPAEMDLIKYLLANSPLLEKMVVQHHEKMCDKAKLNMAKELVRFRRSSPKAQIIFLDPLDEED